MHTYQQEELPSNRCTMMFRCFMMYQGPYGYLDFDQNSPSYIWHLHITYSNITLTILYITKISTQSNMTSYIITCNSYIMSCTAHLQDSNLLSFIIQCVIPSLQFSWPQSFFVQFAHTRVLTIVIPSHACHSTAKWVTWYVLQTYTLAQKSRYVHMSMNCVF